MARVGRGGIGVCLVKRATIEGQLGLAEVAVSTMGLRVKKGTPPAIAKSVPPPSCSSPMPWQLSQGRISAVGLENEVITKLCGVVVKNPQKNRNFVEKVVRGLRGHDGVWQNHLSLSC